MNENENINEKNEGLDEISNLNEISDKSLQDKNQEISAEKKFSWKKEVWDWVQAIAIALIVSLIIRNYVFTLAQVQGESMEPTLQDSNRLYVNRLFYKPQKQDIVIFTPASDPNRPYIKRVIATEGDTVYIDFEKGQVYVNDKPLKEPYIADPTKLVGSYISKLIKSGDYSRENPIVVEKDKIFVMGDNRNNSKDSRELGQIPLSEVIGGAEFRFWPVNEIGRISHEADSINEN